MKQFQGIENCEIPQRVYDDLKIKFAARRVPYSKQHIRTFLKEFKYTKYHKNINSIHSKLTGQCGNNIIDSNLQQQLIMDFNQFTRQYRFMRMEKEINRINSFMIRTIYTLSTIT